MVSARLRGGAALLAVLLCPFAFGAITASDGCTAVNRREGRTLESRCYSIEVAGLARTFRLYAPAGHPGPLPLLLVLHGGGGGGGNMEWLTRQGLNRIADRDGALIAYPDGIGKGWNDGRGDLKSKAAQQNVDDVGFLRALPRQIATSFPVDPQRVYATGISNGGLMSYRLACDASDVFAAVAPVAASMSELLAPRCAPSRPVPMAIFNGTDDPIMPWNGGEIKVLWAARGKVLSTAATVARWMELDRCGPLYQAGGLLDTVPDDDTAVLRQSAQCAGHAAIDLYEIRGGGHTWPGGEPYLGKWLVGRVSREIDANEVIWRFFKDHPLR